MIEIWVAIIAVLGMLVVNVWGWYISSNRAKLIAATVAEATAKQVNIEAGGNKEKNLARDIRVDKLPCQTDPNYLRRQGKMEQQLDDTIKRLERIESKLNGK